MRNADVAMSRAKSLGGGLVEIFAAHMHADIVRRLELTSDLQRAVTEEQLAVEFQPIVELATSRVTGVEALVRWWRGGEQVPPVEFLGIAEESGLIVPIGDWVLRAACAQLAQWHRSSWDIGVSVNFSQRQIGAPGFVESVLAALANSDLPASALTIEVAEQVLEAHRGETARRLSELRRHGVQIAIDDFGTGYASLRNLRQLPVDIIKVDPSFVSGVGTDETLTLLTHTIVRLGHDLGLTVVAEGIQRPRQLELLREMGCARGQGYLVARPMAAPGVESMIRTSAVGYGPDVTEQGKTPAPAS
jgi:EAL domain-containing protein (putative c-di-GMP-specific phosphodiesterase class I)